MTNFVGYSVGTEKPFESMNGYLILGEMHISSRERVIIGYRETDRLSQNGIPVCAFVTARAVPRSENPREWYWGNYFDGNSTEANRIAAWRDFVKRAAIDPAE